MTPASTRPDLRRIGESAFTEVLSVVLSLPATVRNSARHSPLSVVPDQITSTVHLAGQRLSGSVQVQLPQAFVAHAVHLLTGLDGAAGDTNAVQDDAAGELANMVAGRVAARLAADGYPCTLGTPSVSRRPRSPIEIQPGADHGRTVLICEGHCLSLELQCRYAAHDTQNPKH
jgi:CheY-specific phosphatase CheX